MDKKVCIAYVFCTLLVKPTEGSITCSYSSEQVGLAPNVLQNPTTSTSTWSDCPFTTVRECTSAQFQREVEGIIAGLALIEVRCACIAFRKNIPLESYLV